MEDREIIDLYWQRDETAISHTAEKYGSRLLRLGRNLLPPEDAEECVNDTYLAAWNQIPPTVPLHLFAWLAKVCRNAACKKLAWYKAGKRSAEIVPLQEELLQCLPRNATEEEAEAEELGELLSRFLRTLPEEKRYFFLRRYWFGDSIADIAAACGCGESKVKVTLHRTRQQLKQVLEQEGVSL